MMLLTKTGKKINIDPYVDQMVSNLRLGRDIREQTPIGQKANGDFIWWVDECSKSKKKNPTLDKRSVRDMIKAVKQMVVTEEKGKIGP